jgi:hypothetical protein
MKKMMLTACAILTISTAINAQQRTCGTMENLELRKKANPALEQKMAEDEKLIREWMTAHPSPVAATINLPAVKGFTPTGNTDTDRINYAIAKEANYKTAGNNTARPAIDPRKKEAHILKGKKQSFITK